MKTGTICDNPVTGQRAHLVVGPEQTGGASFAIEWTIAPRRGRDGVPAHLHPTASERFTIRCGRARYRLGKNEGELGPGATIEMPAGVPHIHPWSVSDEPLRYRQEAVAEEPDGDLLERSLDGLLTMFALAREGRVNAKGVPNPLQMAVLGHYMMPGTFLAVLPCGLQRALLPLPAALGRAFGYRPIYPRHASLATVAGTSP